jgi:alkylation response protein AidB-like acyl-CoA dehydrogenase
MDFTESEELSFLRQELRRLLSSFGHAYYAERTRAGAKLDALWRRMAESGLLGVNVPTEYGGAGAGILELSVVCEELAASGCPLLMLILTGAICTSVLVRHGSEAQKRTWLPRFVKGDAKMAFAITEPNAGSNSHRLETVARRQGDRYVLRGSKCFISGVDEASAILVVARLEPNEGAADTKKSRLGLFVVPTEAKGLEIRPIPFEIAAPEKQFALFFDEVVVSIEERVGAEGEGWNALFAGLNPERITVAATANGIARYALAKAATYAGERKVWGGPIGSHQGLAHPLAQCKVDVELARLMTTKAAWLYDRGLDAGEAANMAKLAAADAALEALDQSIQTHGGNGLTSEYGLSDLWGIARLFRTAPVSREMILNFVAQHSLGLPRSY